MDLLSLLVLDANCYRKDQFRAFRSLQVYNQLFPGFVSIVKGQKIGNKYIVSRKVRHSQRMNDRYFTLWIKTEQNGYGSLRSLCGMHGGSRGVLLAYRKCFVLHRGMESDKRKIHLFTARNEKSRSKRQEIFWMKLWSELDFACTCKRKPLCSEKMLKCHNPFCLSGKCFHLPCLNFKRMPKNANDN